LGDVCAVERDEEISEVIVDGDGKKGAKIKGGREKE
jgi:hypothetical protein